METRWIYTPQGQVVYYEEDGHIFTREGKYSFWLDSGWWYRVPDGLASYFVKDDRIYSPNGKAAYFYGEEAS